MAINTNVPVTIDSSNVPVTIDTSNPLYLHPSDHPGLILVSKTFEGSGFAAWKHAMSIALSAKNKLGFVNGEITADTTPNQQVLWKRCNEMVISWIMNSISKDIGDSVLYAQSARELWTELNDRYGQANGNNYIVNNRFYVTFHDVQLISSIIFNGNLFRFITKT